MPIWADFFKIFTYAFTPDPLAKKVDTKNLTGASISQPDGIPQMGQDGQWGGGNNQLIRYRESNDFIDLSTVTNRVSRYKEYERLRNVPEIEMAMTVFSDEACIAGDTKIVTPFGPQTIEWLTKTQKDRFLVYCYDQKKNDYSLGWAYNPRLVRKSNTVKILLDNGDSFTVTPDHRVLTRTGTWSPAGNLKMGDELMPFYRLSHNKYTPVKTNQFPRIWTHQKGWIHEKQFTDEWRFGKTDEKYDQVNKICRLIVSGITLRETAKIMGHEFNSVVTWMQNEGFYFKELRLLAKHRTTRRVVGVMPGPETDVYDLSVEDHQCFATESVILHNCQKDEDGNIFKIEVENEEVKKELEFAFYHRDMWNMNKRAWNWFKNLCIFGDFFCELVINPNNPKEGVYKLSPLPPDSVYRIETTKGKVVEFQQSKEGPDYQSLTRAPVTQATDIEIQQATAIRFAPEQIVHMKIGDDRKTFYPYGQSLIEPARGPAHQLRLMEDAMVVYRLVRAPERRVFYIDVGQLPPFKAEAFIDRMKDQFRKKKVATTRVPTPGANQVEERWTPPSADEDYWLPIRPNSRTRIETLPGAQNLGEIDDAIYFRNKLFTALNFPKNYFANEDTQQTRITLSAQDVKFARMIERLQSHFEDGLWEIADRHLQLLGYPPETYQDLKLKMTPPSDWRELSRAEVVTGRITNAGSLKGSQILADFDILTKWMKYSEDDAEEILARLKLQKLEDLKLQVLAQNPQLLGIGIPGQDPHPGQELGAEPGGPSPNPAPGGPTPAPGGGGAQQPPQAPPAAPPGGEPPQKSNGQPLENPDDESIKKYDLELQDYEREADHEDIDYSTGEE